MSYFDHVRNQIGKMQNPGGFYFAEVAAIDPEERQLKVIIEPFGLETGWCKVLKDTYYLIKDSMGQLVEPEWPYRVGQEVLVAVVQGSHQSDQYVVLGLIDQGEVSQQ